MEGMDRIVRLERRDRLKRVGMERIESLEQMQESIQCEVKKALTTRLTLERIKSLGGMLKRIHGGECKYSLTTRLGMERRERLEGLQE